MIDAAYGERMNARLLTFLHALIISVFLWATGALAFEIETTDFTLGNGLRVVLIEDHRAPVVTHTIWYRVGSADEAAGKSGLAHFFEHVLFKGTKKYPYGAFERLLDENGGQKNAFTQRDATAYYERIGSDRLGLVMELEADRMHNLVLTEEAVQSELKVVQEERRMRTDDNPTALLAEQMDAALYLAHPYGRPVIGWADDLERLTLADAQAFYHAHYTPANAVVVVVGDVTPDEVRALAEKHYGPLQNTFRPQPRRRTMEPVPIAARRITLSDPRASNPVLMRNYLAPSYITATGNDAAALQLFGNIMGGDSGSRLYKELVFNRKIASEIASWYSGSQLDSGTFGIFAAPTQSTDVTLLEAEIDKMLTEAIEKGVTQQELDEAKAKVAANFIYALDEPASFGGLVGLAATFGQSPKATLSRLDQFETVTLKDVQEAARTYIDRKRSVTGVLLPSSAEAKPW